MLFEGFANRYFPEQIEHTSVGTLTARSHAAQVAGYYLITRRFDHSPGSIINLFNQYLLVDAGNGKVILNAGEQADSYSEIGPFLWRQDNGSDLLAVNMQVGKPVLMATSGTAATFAFQPLPFWKTLPFVLAISAFSVLVLLVTIFSWPISKVVQRYYGIQRDISKDQKRAFFIRQFASFLVLFTLVAWILLIVPNANDGLSEQNNFQIIATQIMTIFSTAVAIVALFINFKDTIFADHSKFRRLNRVLWMMSVMLLIWQYYTFDLLEIETDF